MRFGRLLVSSAWVSVDLLVRLFVYSVLGRFAWWIEFGSQRALCDPTPWTLPALFTGLVWRWVLLATSPQGTSPRSTLSFPLTSPKSPFYSTPPLREFIAVIHICSLVHPLARTEPIASFLFMVFLLSIGAVKEP